ncbi:MAG: outer membrane protein assembly factor BamA [Aaplasma endosymbiont of Hyalomma asiaticum]
MRYFLAFVLLLALCVVADHASAVEINEVRVEGNQRLDSETVEFYAKVDLSAEITSDEIDKVIKNLYATGLFKEVNVATEGADLLIKVKENPVLRNLVIKGNKAFSDKNLANDIFKLRKMGVYTEAKLERDLANLHALYQSQGMLGVKISYTVKPAPRNNVDVEVRITEGDVTRVEKIKFIGNNVYTDKQLKSVLETRERKTYDIFGYFGSKSKFYSERLISDQSRLRDFYTSNGYLDFRVRSVTTEVNENLKRATVVFSLEEGNKYHFGNSVVTVDDSPMSEEEIGKSLSSLVLTKEGDVLNMGLVEKTTALLTAYLNEKGNLFATVRSDYRVDGNKVHIQYDVKMGHSVYVRRINIVGNTRTQDLVIRRKLGMTEGDVYSTYAMRQSRRRLMNLDFFENVDVDTQRVTDSLVDINFTVKERGTGSFDVGAGFSPLSGLVGKISVRERNLLGTGKVVGFELVRSLSGLSSVLDFVTPDIFDSEVSFGLGAFYAHQGSSLAKSVNGLFPAESPFSSTNAGYSARLSCSLTDNLAASLQYYYKYHSIHNVGSSASEYIKEQEGVHYDSSVGYSLMYSSIDSMYKPRQGTYIQLSQSFSGIGGNLHYVKTEASSAHLYPVLKWLNGDITLKIKPAVGYVFAYGGEKVKIGQRFFIGGNEVRGFSSSGIGPRDKKTQEALGGKLYYGLVTQMDFPVGLPENLGIRGSLFLDIASLYGLDYSRPEGYRTSSTPRVSVGFGFSWRSPFGPIRVDFGFPIVSETFDVKEVMRISTDTGI